MTQVSTHAYMLFEEILILFHLSTFRSKQVANLMNSAEISRHPTIINVNEFQYAF